MSDEHVKRGATLVEDEDIEYEWEGAEDGTIRGVYHCLECGEKLEVRERRGMETYVELGCGCGAVSLHLKIGVTIGLDIDQWQSKHPRDLGRIE